MAADGSIIIDTRIDTDGISSGVKEVQAAFKDLANSVKEINANINSIFHDGFEKLEDSFQSLQQKSEKVENSMDKMGDSAKKTGTTVSNSFNKMDTSGASRKVNLLGRQFEGLGTIVKRIGFLVGSAFAVGKLIQFGKESIELGSDLAEVQNVVDVTFTTMSDKVNEFAKNAMTSAGLSETMAKRYVGTFGAMSKSFGFSEQQAYDMSTALTQLTGDVASFYNISQDLAYIKLKSVFTGETETLKDLGVVMSQSALDQYALANGYGKTTSEMTEQEKVALRLAFVQKQLSAASGDFIRTSDSWANQVRVMQLQLQSLKATVGQGLINIFTPVLKVINILLGKLATLANAFKSFTELITGKKSSGQTSGSGAGLAGTGAIADTADQYGQAADNAEKLADATNDNTKATKKANKETKNYLSSLDEVHKASSTEGTSSTPSGSGSGGTGSGGGGLPSSVGNVDYGSLAEGETALDKISDSAKKLADLLKRFWKPFQDAWKKEGKNTINAAKTALSGIAKLAKSVGKSLVEVWTNGTGTTMLTTMLKIAQNVLKTIGNIASGLADAWNKNNVGTQIIQNIANELVAVLQFVERIASATAKWAANLDFYPLLESISNLTSTFAPILESIGNTLEWIYKNVILPMLKWVTETGLPLAINLLTTVVKAFSDNIGVIAAFFAAWKTVELLSFIQQAGGVVGALNLIKAAIYENVAAKLVDKAETAYLTALYAKDFVVSVAQTVVSLGKQAAAFVANTAVKIANTTAQVAMTAATTAWNAICVIATAATKALSAAVAFLTSPFGLVVVAIAAAIAIGVLLYKNWDKIKEVAGAVWSWIKDKTLTFVNTISSSLKNLASKIVTIWDNIKSSAYQKWTAIWSTVGNLVEKIKDGIVKKFTSAKNKVVDIFGGIKDTIRSILNKVIGIVNRAIGTVNSAIGGIESAFSFGPWEVPTPFGRKSIGFRATFPRVPTVPYLAKGAVIPPRSEFLAVLGDQKQGNNIETPEALLRKIVREESAGQQSSGNYRFTAQINRRTVFDEIIEEAKLRQNTSGRNPFELA
nr:MAG TPA: minor tail protein [Caudoviricetes sp.]